METHSNILAWEIPWTGKPGWLQSMGGKELDTTEHVHACSVIIYVSCETYHLQNSDFTQFHYHDKYNELEFLGNSKDTETCDLIESERSNIWLLVVVIRANKTVRN